MTTSDFLAGTVSFSNLYPLIFSPADAQEVSNAGAQAFIEVQGAFFTSTARRSLVVNPNWPADWQSLVTWVEPLVKSGSVLGLFLGDELLEQGLNAAQIATAADAIRATFPRGSAVIYYNEGHRKIDASLKIPSSIDWFSVDFYHFDGPQADFVSSQVKPLYDRFIFPKLAPGQQVALVPGAFSSAKNPSCSAACYDRMNSMDVAHYDAWAQVDGRIVAILPWFWGVCTSCIGHTLDESGCQSAPQTLAAFQAIGKKITGKGVMSPAPIPSPGPSPAPIPSPAPAHVTCRNCPACLQQCQLTEHACVTACVERRNRVCVGAMRRTMDERPPCFHLSMLVILI